VEIKRIRGLYFLYAYALGLRKALERVQFDRNVFAMRNYQTGEVNFGTPLDANFVEKYGASCLDFHRADLHNALTQPFRRITFANVDWIYGHNVTALYP